MIPKMLRVTQVPEYLNVSQQYFNNHMRPHLTELKLGTQIICFNRDELDAYIDMLFEKERKSKEKAKKEERKCLTKSKDLSKETVSGGLKNVSKVDDFEKVRERLTMKKRKAI